MKTQPKNRQKILKLLRNKYLIVAVVAIVWILFLDSNSIYNWLRDRRLVKSQELQKEYFRLGIKNLDEKLQELSSNKDSLEKFAREEYLFHEPDEDIYIFPQQK